MKYKIGDLVKIKSMSWWNEQPKPGYINRIIMGDIHFPEEMALGCCGKIGEIIEIYRNKLYRIMFKNDSSWNFFDNWIEEEVRRININLRHMRNEI